MTAIVIDTGSSTTKFGSTCDDKPSLVIPTRTGKHKYKSFRNDNLVQIGNFDLSLFKPYYPLDQSYTNFDELEKIWIYGLKELDYFDTNCPLILTKFRNKNDNYRMIHTFFEAFDACEYFQASQNVLSLFAEGLTTGIMVRSGYQSTDITPIFEGYALTSCNRSLDIAGKQVDEYLENLLTRSGVYFQSISDRENYRSIKESSCAVALDSQSAKVNSSNGDNYTLPDGQRICISDFKFLSPELLFDPSLFGYDLLGISTLTFNSIQATDIDLRNKFYSNVYLSGGSTLFKGFSDRVKTDLIIQAPKTIRVNVNENKFGINNAWIGGRIISKLESFNQQTVTKEEYEEYGPTLIDRKLFN